MSFLTDSRFTRFFLNEKTNIQQNIFMHMPPTLGKFPAAKNVYKDTWNISAFVVLFIYLS